ncbi:MAG: hypothetical protein RL660_1136 [Bacteroidota bacterium]|jgi:hypothetical protein
MQLGTKNIQYLMITSNNLPKIPPRSTKPKTQNPIRQTTHPNSLTNTNPIQTLLKPYSSVIMFILTMVETPKYLIDQACLQNN